MLSVMAAEYFAEGKVPQRWGLEHPWRVPAKTFRTENGYIATTATGSNMYPALCKVLGLEHLIDDARFKTNTDRVKNRDLIYPVIEKVMRSKTSEEWDKLFEDAGLPSGIMYTLDKVFQNPQVLERGMLEIVNHPTLGQLKMIGLPFKFESSETKKMTAPPMLGEHTDEILRTVADYDDDKITRLKQNKIVS